MATEQGSMSVQDAPSDVEVDRSTLAPSDRRGAVVFAGATTLTVAGVALSLLDSIAVWVIGQVLFALALLQWFILLHEAGHLTLFRTRALNVAAGHVCGLLALIPFASWRRVHGLHHLWTGWQDLDPTTATLVPRTRSRGEIVLVDIAWRLWLPLFSIVYRIGNYWNPRRLARFFPQPGQRWRIALNALALCACYVAVIMWLGPQQAVRIFAVALFLALALQDPLILSQHTHIPQRVSAGRPVQPLRPTAQAQYTRSLRFPPWIAQWLLINFNAHELHHRYTAVPGYRLRELACMQPNEVDWYLWLRAAKRMRGSVFLFENRETTDFPL